MDRAEKYKTLFCFGLFGIVVVVLIGRLGYLQVRRAAPNRESVKIARNLYHPRAAERGTIVDRNGNKLAYDRPVFTVRAEFQARVQKRVTRIPEKDIELLASRLASHLMAGRGQPGSRAQLRQRIAQRIRKAKHVELKTRSRKYDYLKADFLVARDVDAYEVIRRLRHEVKLWRQKGDLPGLLHLCFLEGFKRTYPDREFTIGPVGNHYVAKQEVVKDHRGARLISYEGHTGLESCQGLWPSGPGVRADSEGPRFYRLDFRDSRRRRFWSGIGEEPQPATRLHTTLDLELQKLAHAELIRADEAVVDRYKSSYEWGAMVLVHVPTGDVLALASHYPRPKGKRKGKGTPPCAPIENAFEPGSVVKPLVIGLALERGKVHWGERFDCTPTLPQFGKPVAGHPRRIIRDDHPCGELQPHGIIVNSSNIGAVMIGTRLGKDGMVDYLKLYGLCQKTGLGLPAEVKGRRGRTGIDGILKMSDRNFGQWTGPSLSFGYELNITAVQLARAYLRLLSGSRRELRLVAAIDVGSRRLEARSKQPQDRFLSEDTAILIVAAMTDVVADRDPHATGRQLHDMLEKQGHPWPLIAGKTGTSVSMIDRVSKKTATFVGLAPAHTPRYLVVCVLRKDRAAQFYGGRYAALPAGRLLLSALSLEVSRGKAKRAKVERRRQPGDADRRLQPGPVRVPDGDRGAPPKRVIPGNQKSGG